jgi:hypothetical protein
LFIFFLLSQGFGSFNLLVADYFALSVTPHRRKFFACTQEL